MNICLDKDINSLKNAVFHAFVYGVGAAFMAVVSFMYLLPLDTALGIVIFVLMMIGLAAFGLFFGYSIWYVVTYLVTRRTLFIISKKDKEQLVRVQKGKKVIATITREEIDFCSAKKLWEPLKGIYPNKLVIKLKDGKSYTSYFLEDPAIGKGYVNSVMKGTSIEK